MVSKMLTPPTSLYIMYTSLLPGPTAMSTTVADIASWLPPDVISVDSLTVT